MRRQERKLNRWGGYDYAQPGWYFVTICTKKRRHFFGKIRDRYMCLNTCGSILYRQWNWLEKQYPHVRLDAFIVMPNHIHGILIIDADNAAAQNEHQKMNNDTVPVGTGRDLSLHEQNRQSPQINKTRAKSLSQLIGAFKTTSSKIIRQSGCGDFSWQRSFYDHIIRTQESYFKIRRYIQYNPALWNRDRNNI